jgi:hypothetical protein
LRAGKSAITLTGEKFNIVLAIILDDCDQIE